MKVKQQIFQFRMEWNGFIKEMMEKLDQQNVKSTNVDIGALMILQ